MPPGTHVQIVESVQRSAYNSYQIFGPAPDNGHRSPGYSYELNPGTLIFNTRTANFRRIWRSTLLVLLPDGFWQVMASATGADPSPLLTPAIQQLILSDRRQRLLLAITQRIAHLNRTNNGSDLQHAYEMLASVEAGILRANPEFVREAFDMWLSNTAIICRRSKTEILRFLAISLKQQPLPDENRPTEGRPLRGLIFPQDKDQ